MAKTRNFWPRSYTLEEKIALVTEIERRYRAGGVTLKAAAQAAGTTDTCGRKDYLARFRKDYLAHWATL